MKELNKLERKVVGLVDRNQTPPIDPQVLKMVEKLKGGNDQEGVLDIQKPEGIITRLIARHQRL